MRKIIQIAISISHSFFNDSAILIVRCDDGTVWKRSLFDNDDDKEWKKIKSIPQD